MTTATTKSVNQRFPSRIFVKIQIETLDDEFSCLQRPAFLNELWPKRILDENHFVKLSKQQQRQNSTLVKTHHEEEAEDDTFEFTHIENVKHFNGLPRVKEKTFCSFFLSFVRSGRHFNSQNW